MWKFDGRFLSATFEPGATWPARSGGLFGNNSRVRYGPDQRALALDNEFYRIIKRGEKHGPSWVDDEEMLIPGRREGWFVPLEPQFQTDRGTLAAGRFGIHPDGDLPGTDGCIGVFGGDYDRLYKMLIDPSIMGILEVCIKDNYRWW